MTRRGMPRAALLTLLLRSSSLRTKLKVTNGWRKHARPGGVGGAVVLVAAGCW